MKEKDFNQYFVSYINNYTEGWAYKIPDPRKGFSTSSAKRPYDIQGAYKDMDLYVESKFLKGYKAFNFNKIEPHQIYYLTQVSNSISKNFTTRYPLICLAIWEPRKFIHMYFFDIKLINKLIKNKKSILKKELLKLKSENYYIDMSLKKEHTYNINRIKHVILKDEKEFYERTS